MNTKIQPKEENRAWEITKAVVGFVCFAVVAFVVFGAIMAAVSSVVNPDRK